MVAGQRRCKPEAGAPVATRRIVTTQQRRAPRRRIIGANWEAQQPRRGRPPATKPRKATRVYLSQRQRKHWLALAEGLSSLGETRVEVADLVIRHLEHELDRMQSGLTGEGQLLPVGVVDLKSVYFLLDLHPPAKETSQFNITMFTDTREKMAVMTIRFQGVFRATWSQVFGLAVELLHHRLADTRGRMGIVEQFDNTQDLADYLFRPRQLRFDNW